MTIEAWVSVGIIAAVTGVMMTNRVAIDVAMLAGLVLLMLSGILPPDRALAGFAHPAVFMIGSLFVVAAGLHRTGAIYGVAQRLLGRPRSTTEAQVRLMVPVALLSAFVNNTPIVAMYLPVVRDWARQMRLSASKVFMPLSFAAIMGGKITLIGSSSNIVVMGLYSRYLEQQPAGLEPFSSVGLSSLKQFWGPAALGLPCAVAGIAFVVLVSRWLLPARRGVREDVLDARQYTVHMDVSPGSAVVGKTIEGAGLRHLPGLFLTEVERSGEQHPAPPPDFVIRAGDRLQFAGILESVVDLRKIRGLTPATDQVQKVAAAQPQRALVEAVVSHHSPLVGQTVRESRFRTVYNAAIIAVHRNGEQLNAKVGDILLKPGDTLLLETHRGFADAYRNSGDFYLVSQVGGDTMVHHDKAWISFAILGLLVVLLAFTRIEPVAATLLCALAMIATRCLTGTEARRSINRQVIIVIACALGMSKALQSTGAGARLAQQLLDVTSSLSLGPQAALFVFFLLAALFGQLVTNNGAAVLMFPIAIETARELAVSPEPFVFSLIVAAGASFMTPVGYQTNLMIHGPGGYHFLDFARIGTPLTIVIAVVVSLICPLVFPFA